MQKTITVDIDLEDFSSDELRQELRDRKEYLPVEMDEIKHLLRHGIEDRDWSKIEEFAEKLDVHFFRRK